MRLISRAEFLVSIASLLLAFIVVHAMYEGVIRPSASEFLEFQRVNRVADETYEPEQSLFVVLRDFEQEACFVLLLWALAILGFKLFRAFRQHRQLGFDYIGVDENAAIDLEQAARIATDLRGMPDRTESYLLPRVLLNAAERFTATKSIEGAANEALHQCEEEGSRLESELSIIRYIAWAIPSVGFIGTVRGIGDALAEAHKAVDGDISGVTDNLGVAFNSTFVALVISIVLMFFVHQVQLAQERLVLETQRYSNRRLIGSLVV